VPFFSARLLERFPRADRRGGRDAGSFLGLLAYDSETGLRLFSVLSGAALVIPAVMIARRLWGNRAAAFVGLFVVLQPNLITASAAATIESLYSLPAMCALFLFIRGMDADGMRRRSIATIVLFAVMPVPHFFLLREATGGWTGGSKDVLNPSSPSGYLTRMGFGIGFFPFLYSSPLLLLLVPLGIFGRSRRREDRGAESLLPALGLFPFVIHPLFRVELRHLVPYLPIYLLGAGAGCAELLDWFAARITPRRAAAVALAALVFLSLVPYSVYRYAGLREPRPLER
jgi:hypothetical protein